jgi:uncharacterized protein YprB with RNaseH-like and TPR domain
MKKIKRLYFDIETSPNIGFFWQAGHKVNIGYDSIIKERAIICICYKWEGEKTIYSLTWDNNQDDKKLLKDFIAIANTADELVAHNGDRFDLPWIRTRCLYHRLDMFPNYTTIDTLNHARIKFKFNRNRLDYISKFLGVVGKITTNYDLWKSIVLDNNKTALKKMVEYCKGDINILEKIYKIMSLHLPNKTHFGALIGNGKYSCPECGGLHLTKASRRTTSTGITRLQLKCKDCTKYHTVPEKSYEKFFKE